MNTPTPHNNASSGIEGVRTPGPWHNYQDPMSGMLYVTDDAGNTIAMTSPMEDDAGAEAANARLIAAAPDLLAALKAVYVWQAGSWLLPTDLWEQMRYAIAKTEPTP